MPHNLFLVDKVHDIYEIYKDYMIFLTTRSVGESKLYI